MCGRYTHKYTWKQLHRLLNLLTPPIEFGARYNVAPTQLAPVVRVGEVEGHPGKGRRLDLLRWGLIPSWAKDESFGAKTVNARAETVTTSPAFRDSFKRRRCLVPVSGFYEWKKLGTGPARKQPYYITSSDGEPLMLAGLWSSWQAPTATLETFTILTTTPNELVAKLHDRMPVILGENDWAAWLDPDSPGGSSITALLRPYPAELMLSFPVSTKVNSPKNDGPELIQNVEQQEFTQKNEPGLFS